MPPFVRTCEPMNRRTFIAATASCLAPVLLYAQRGSGLRRIGFLGVSRNADGRSYPAFVAELDRLGWSEGRNIAFEYRWSDERNERLPDLAADLVRAQVELIVTSGATGTKAAMSATTTIPIVMAVAANPVAFGLVASFARPGGNVTGIALPVVDWGKWLELAREAVPGLTRVAVLGNSTNVVYADYALQNETAARRLGLLLQMLPVKAVEDFADAFAAIRREGAAAVVVGPDQLFAANIDQVVSLAQASGLPLIGANRLMAEHGATISYGIDYSFTMQRAAVYVDKILRGAKPADLPVEQPSRFELIVNTRAAKAIGLTVSPSLIVRADELIE